MRRLLTAVFACAMISAQAAEPLTLHGKLLDGGGIDDLRITVFTSDGKKIEPYCDQKCGDWFDESSGGEGQSLRKVFKGKAVALIVATEANAGRVAGPGDDEKLLFIKSVKLLK